MKATLRWSWPILAIALAVLVPWACYRGRPARPLELVVVDKTVPFPNWIEHRSLYWLLGYLNVVKSDGTPYDLTRDYVGAYPPAVPGRPPERTADLEPRHLRRASLLYIADTYGVYRDDLKSGDKMLAALERSPVIYGGFGAGEAAAAAAFLRGGGTLVAEFNTLASPTPDDARSVMEDALGVTWTRWIGRYFPRLEDDDEVPRWLVRNWEREWARRWEFEGPGYALLQDDTHVEIFRIGQEAHRIGLVIDRDGRDDALLARAADGVPYPYWFDIVKTSDDTDVLASFRWKLEPAGLARLRVHGLPERFPAVTRRAAPGSGIAYYFAGDFADNPMDAREVPFAGYLALRKGAEAIKLSPSETSFYWRFYVPMMRALITEVERRPRP